LNRQDAKNAKKRRGEREEKMEGRKQKLLSRSGFFCTAKTPRTPRREEEEEKGGLTEVV